MDSHCSEHKFKAVKSSFLEYFSRRLSFSGKTVSADEFLREILGKFIACMLKINGYEVDPESRFNWVEDDWMLSGGISHTGRLGVVEIGECYERLSALAFTDEPHAKPIRNPSDSHRRRQGQFYTPSVLARLIVRHSIKAFVEGNQCKITTIDTLDPGVGAGIFLTEMISEIQDTLRNGLQQCSSSHLLGSYSLYGLDVDEVAILIANAAIREKLRTNTGFITPERIELRVGNSLIGNLDAAEKTFPGNSCDVVQPGRLVGRDRQSCYPDSWLKSRKNFNWTEEFPDIFGRENPGFDLVVGNPPYEVLTVKDSGLDDLHHDLDYFRSHYETCLGKINTYRLMFERSLKLTRRGGVLGFIVPATFLADSSALRLRKRILDQCEIIDLLTIPERDRSFKGVTQAFTIVVARKGKPSRLIKPVFLDKNKGHADHDGINLTVEGLATTGYRIPVIKSEIESRVLSHLLQYPTLGSGWASFKPISAHQGEINLTTHRMWISSGKTGIRLIRGEHISSFVVNHPSASSKRLDWVNPKLLHNISPDGKGKLSFLGHSKNESGSRGRVALARVVNMDSPIRLKAAWVEKDDFLGDMTNYLSNTIISPAFTLGLLNSSLLNWRFRITSANNYVSASEIEKLPIPYQKLANRCSDTTFDSPLKLEPKIMRSILTFKDAELFVNSILKELSEVSVEVSFLVGGIEQIANTLMEADRDQESTKPLITSFRLLIDLLTLKLYDIDAGVGLF